MAMEWRIETGMQGFSLRPSARRRARSLAGSSGSRASFSQFDARLVPIAELYSRHLQGLLDDLERCSARLCFSKLEYPDGRNSNAGCLGELLLIPVKQSASRSALGRREHVSAMGKISRFVNPAESD